MSREIRVDLDGEDDLEYHLPNEKDRFGRPIPHRKAVTGTDRQGNARLMSVVGLMPVVVHGFADDEPHTLIIFEWDIVSGVQDLRFKSVVIEVSFIAAGPRGEAEDDAKKLRLEGGNSSWWDPEIVKAVPSGTASYKHSTRRIGGKETYELGFSVGFQPYFSLGPKYALERDTSTDIADAIRVTGQSFVTGSSRNRPNSVRWIMLENASQRSGVPAYLRTAVLLKRQPDDNGLFLGNVKVETHVSWWEDLKEKKWKLTGQIKPDEPIVFDPNVSQPSAFDSKRNRLDDVDLDAEFQVVTEKVEGGLLA
ncbi:hypothetical protein BBK36DRAFT_1144673 [Trichoderma citrinoviride]|uniref:Uncharacterized protein n=1 Tax=Trichoderma citrinoviride TaxID=58853 RepID=A0A2T4B025_9HYPO|nr:hypothetical protein BBK36DRAFT_1144673 [Trichoderma citrinoviride]PTB62673.1 hypothetical protein BBK36DRAFT_1144673 [Trichoderma citrinoviride]